MMSRLNEPQVVKAIHEFLINEKGYLAWSDSRFKQYGIEPTHQLKISGRIPDIIARNKDTIIAIECKGERSDSRHILEAIGQVTYYKRGSHEQYIGIPETLVDDTLYDIVEYLNVGLLTVDHKLRVHEELVPKHGLLKLENLEEILKLTSKHIDISPIPNISFSRPEPIIITALLATKTCNYKELVSELQKILPSRTRIGSSRTFAMKVLSATLSLGLVEKVGDKISLTPEGYFVAEYFIEKCKSFEGALEDILSLYKPSVYKYTPKKLTIEDVQLIAKFVLLRHPTIEFLVNLLFEMSKVFKKMEFTSREIIEYAKTNYPEKFMLYFVKTCCEKDSMEDISFDDIDERIYDDIKAQLRNAGIIEGKQGSKDYPNDTWRLSFREVYTIRFLK